MPQNLPEMPLTEPPPCEDTGLRHGGAWWFLPSVFALKGIHTAVWTPGQVPMRGLRPTEEAEVWAAVQAGKGRWGLEFRVII